MPPVIAGIAAASAGVAGAGAAIGGALSFTGLVTAAGSLTLLGKIVIGVGLAVAARLLTPKPEQPKPSDQTVEVKQPLPARMFHYGRVRVAGPLAWYETASGTYSPSKHGLYKIVLLSSRQIDAIETHQLNDEAVTIDEDGWIFGYVYDGIPRALATFHLGTDDQLADEMMRDAFPSEWTEEHRLRGVAYAVLQFVSVGSHFSEVFPSGEPQYSAIIRSSLLYDPRKDSTVPGGSGTHLFDDRTTWEWSDNSALCILDYLTYEDGYARPIAEIDLASFMAIANLCDEPVGTNLAAPDDFEPRYRTATTIYLNEPRKNVLQRLLAACDGQIYQRTDGRIGLRGGAWGAPTASVSAAEGELLDAEFTDGTDPLQRYNELAFQFNSPEHNFVEVEGDPWQDAESVVEAGVVITQTVDFSQVPSHTQARRLCKIKIMHDNARWIGKARTSFKGLDMIGESLVSLAWDELDQPAGNFDGPFEITSLSMPADGTGLAVSMQSADATAYDWDPATEAGTPPAVPETMDTRRRRMAAVTAVEDNP